MSHCKNFTTHGFSIQQSNTKKSKSSYIYSLTLCGIRGSQIVLVGKSTLVQMPSVPRLMIISLITTRDCHSAEEKQTILPIEKVFTMRTAAIDVLGTGQNATIAGQQLLWHKSGVHLWRRGLLGQLGVEPLAHGNSTGHHFHSTMVSDHLHLEIAKSSPPPTHSPSAHQWQEHGVRLMKCITVDFLLTWHMIMCTLRIQKIKIGR